MPITFDPDRWRDELAKPDWYWRLVDSPEYKRLTEPARHTNDAERAQLKEDVLSFLEEELAADRVALGLVGPNWDEERKPVDTVVIHHTGNPSDITPARLNAIQLLKLYAPHYARTAELSGQPIWTNHFRSGRPIFWAYHWLIREDGSAERLLEDDEIGWQAGDWAVNCRSVAVCFDGNFEAGVPSARMLGAAAKLIQARYPMVRPDGILGHCEVNRETVCPGTFFANGWKRTILRHLVER
jgi:hypothetical protein